MTGIRLYDTMRRTKVDFEPADPRRVTMYVCGPTVYNRAHIGNARPAVVFDVLARLLRYTYDADKAPGEPSRVVYARNITDIDDKIIAAAAAEGVEPKIITDRYTEFYHADMGALGVLRPDFEPRATDHVAPRTHDDGSVTGMIPMIDDLIAKGAAYVAEGHVLFDVSAPDDYGRLSRRPLDEMIAGARVEVAPYKRNPADFVLWKPSMPAQPGWPSPWGRGRPGWHIECSAMIAAHLGPNAAHPNPTIDIHGGGLDLIFPHHENELAQSSCAHDGAPLARVWMHNGFLSMGDTKMSKSLGNVVTVGELLAQGWHPEVLRLALLSAHYRQPLEWTDKLLVDTKARLDRLYRRKRDGQPGRVDPIFLLLICDDLNAPAALARLSDIEDEEALLASANLLGLLISDRAAWFQQWRWLGDILSDPVGDLSDTDSVTTHVEAVRTVEHIIKEREVARGHRDFAKADRIRDTLTAEGIILEDGPTGTTWRRA